MMPKVSDVCRSKTGFLKAMPKVSDVSISSTQILGMRIIFAVTAN